MHYTIKAQIYSGGESGFVAECLDLPVVIQGQTLDEVMQNLREAIELHLEDESFIRIFIMIKTFLPHIPFIIL